MDITTNGDWQWVGNEYKLMFATTDDPRVVAVIQRDEYVDSMAQTFDSDGINPIIYVDHTGGLRFSHEAGYDGGEAELMQRAYDEWGWGTPTARRWLWIFHGIAAENAWGGYDRSGNWIVATSNNFTDDVGLDRRATYEEARKDCESMASEVSKALDGDVFGIGWAVNESRVLDEKMIDLEDGDWDVNIECWGFIGKEYAQSEAGSFSYGDPDLPELLDLSEIEDDIFGARKRWLEAQL